jgi:hypothetical protein
MMRRNLSKLAEELNDLTKYPDGKSAKDFYGDRSTIDYWRTIQGTHVGFMGNVGAGVPVAGPESFLGGSGTANPLLEPLLKKHPKGTFVGDAVRKKNFPLSAINFIENFVGTDDAEIKGRIDAAEKRMEDYIEKTLVNKSELDSLILGNPKVKQFLKTSSRKDLLLSLLQNPKQFDIVTEQEMNGKSAVDGTPLVPYSSQQAKDYRNFDYLRRDASRYFMHGDENKENKGLRMFETLFQHHTGSAELDSTIVSRLMSTEGVSGTSSEIDRYKIGSTDDIKSQMKKWPIPSIGLEYDHSDDQKESKLKELKAAIGEAYIHNQACLRLFGNKGKPIRLSRGFGRVVPFATNAEGLSAQKIKIEMGKSAVDVTGHVKVLAAAAKGNAPVRFKSRPMCGFAESNKVGSGFTGFSVSADFPPEAFLSSFGGARFQGSSFEYEKESAIIGASSIQYSPKEFGIFQAVVLPWDERRFVTSEEIDLLLEEVADEAKSKYADDNDVSPKWIDSYVRTKQSNALHELNTVMFCYFMGNTPYDKKAYDTDKSPPVVNPVGQDRWAVNATYYRDTMAKLEATIARAKAKRKESKS